MSEPRLLRVKRISVTKLFGLYDHVIDLNLAERVTIIHGPNGVGKTVILKLIAALFSGRLRAFQRVPFESIRVDLTESFQVVIHQVSSVQASSPGSQARNVQIRLTLVDPDGTAKSELLKLGGPLLFQAKAGPAPESPIVETATVAYESALIDALVSRLRVGQEEDPRGVLVSSDDFVIDYAGSGRSRLGHQVPVWFEEFRQRASIHIIGTERLRRLESGSSAGSREKARTTSTVRSYAEDLHKRITDALAQYARESQELDQSFPMRLLRSPPQELTVKDIKERMADLDRKRATLKALGLLDDSAASPFDETSLDHMDPTERRAMTLYVQDTGHKLGVLDDLARRIELLRDTVNAKFKNKAIRFDREAGFAAVGHDETVLDLDVLSSGEQHELVLLYDLLFHVKPDTLVLIDEPELSLHVGWQKQFLSDLLEIVQAAKFDALVATHSPFIVGDHSDLMVTLAMEDE